MSDIDERTAFAALDGDHNARAAVVAFYREDMAAVLVGSRDIEHIDTDESLQSFWAFTWERAATCPRGNGSSFSSWIVAQARSFLSALRATSIPSNDSVVIKCEPRSGELASSEATVLRAQTGDKRAVLELVNNHMRWVRQCVAWRGVPQRDRDDLAQEIMLKAIRNLDKFKVGARGTFRGWLARVAKNSIIDYRRKAKPERELEDWDAPDVPDGFPLAIALRQALMEMAAQQRTVFLMSYLDGLTLQEIADDLGLNPSRAFSLLQQARSVIGVHFPGTFPEPSKRKSRPPKKKR